MALVNFVEAWIEKEAFPEGLRTIYVIKWIDVKGNEKWFRTQNFYRFLSEYRQLLFLDDSAVDQITEEIGEQSDDTIH